MLSLSISGSFAEEDIGRQGASTAAGNAAPGRGLEVAVANLQDYCNGKLLFFSCSVFFLYSLKSISVFSNSTFVTFEYNFFRIGEQAFISF